jgi:hypothetical protein
MEKLTVISPRVAKQHRDIFKKAARKASGVRGGSSARLALQAFVF